MLKETSHGSALNYMTQIDRNFMCIENIRAIYLNGKIHKFT